MRGPGTAPTQASERPPLGYLPEQFLPGWRTVSNWWSKSGCRKDRAAHARSRCVVDAFFDDAYAQMLGSDSPVSLLTRFPWPPEKRHDGPEKQALVSYLRGFADELDDLEIGEVELVRRELASLELAEDFTFENMSPPKSHRPQAETASLLTVLESRIEHWAHQGYDISTLSARAREMTGSPPSPPVHRILDWLGEVERMATAPDLRRWFESLPGAEQDHCYWLCVDSLRKAAAEIDPTRDHDDEDMA